MAERMLITRRGGTPDKTAGGAAILDFRGEAAAANDYGDVQVVQHVPQGVIASTPDGKNDPALVRRLESTREYRVKRLLETNIIDIGAFRVDVDSLEVDPPVPAALRVPSGLADTWPHHLVQLAGPPTPEWIERIEKEEIDVAEPISRYALFVHAQPAQVAALREIRLADAPPGIPSFVTWTGPFHPAYRLSRDLRRGRGKVSHLLVSVYPDEEAPATRQSIAAFGWQVVDEWGKEGRYRDRFAFLVVQAGRKQAAQIARLPYVRSIECYTPSLSPDSERSAQIIAAQLDGKPAPDTAPLAGYRAFLAGCGLDGSGVTVGICDSGVDTNDVSDLHPDLAGRLAFFHNVTGDASPVDESGHGTLVAGIAVGSGASGGFGPGGWTLGLGMAPAARFGVINALHKLKVPTSRDVARYTALMVTQGAQLMNNSWKQGPPSGYTSRAAEVDGLARDPSGDSRADPKGDYLVMVFSAGNAGPNPHTITEPKEAKNPIVVGSSLNWNRKGDDIRGVAPRSSRGPTADGRIAPTVVAPGEKVVAARTRFRASGVRPLQAFKDEAGAEHDDHASDSGTSMSAPHVTGVCALLIQWWRSTHAGKNPSLAMLKALLVNGAEDLAGGPSGRKKPLRLGHIPDPNQGWGRVCIQNILTGPKILQDQERPFTTPGEHAHTISVRAHDPTRPLKITLAWTDVPGSAITLPALVNDLDLEAVEMLPDGTRRVYKGNNFIGGFSVPDSVPDKDDFDSLNNIECVYIRSPGGTYAVSVLPHTLTGSALPPFTLTAVYQDYALVIDNAVEVPST